MNNNRKKKTQTQTPGEERLKCFLDMIAPSVIQFYTLYLREYVPQCLGTQGISDCNG